MNPGGGVGGGQAVRAMDMDDPVDRAAWDAFVDSSPAGCVFHGSAWARAVGPALPVGMTLRHLACFDGGGGGIVAGHVSAARRKFGLREAVLPVAMPYGGYLTAAASGTDAAAEGVQALAAAVSRLASREDYVQAPGFGDPGVLAAAGYRVAPRSTFHIDLTRPEEQIRAALDDSTRRQVAKAGKAGFDAVDDPSIDDAWALLQATFERRGVPCPIPPAVFRAAAESPYLAANRRFVALARDRRLAAFALLLRSRGTSHYAFAATCPDHLKSGAASLVVWRCLLASAAAGDVTFDFVGANIPSIARFKNGFGPVAVETPRLVRTRGAAGWLAQRLRDRRW